MRAEAIKENINFATRFLGRSNEDILNIPICLVGVEYALQDDYGKYYPREIAVVRMSFAHGIEDYAHYFLKVGNVPQGSYGSMRQHSERTHQIPFLDVDVEKGTDAYSVVYSHIRAVMRRGLKFRAEDADPPLFHMSGDSDLEQTEGCLKTLFEWSGSSPEKEIRRFAPATTVLTKVLGEDVCGPTFAHKILTNVTWDHLKGVSCTWHFDREIHYCALATARKMAFSLIDALKVQLSLKLTPRHLPSVEAETKMEFFDTVPFEIKSEPGPPSNACEYLLICINRFNFYSSYRGLRFGQRFDYHKS